MLMRAGSSLLPLDKHLHKEHDGIGTIFWIFMIHTVATTLFQKSPEEQQVKQRQGSAAR